MKNILENLSEWFLSPVGALVYESFLREFSCVQKLIIGNNFLHLAHIPRENIFKKHTQIIDKDFCGNIKFLPFAENTFDSVFVPLVHHKIKNITCLCKELERIIKPGGYLVFMGINLYSCWGLKTLLFKNYSHSCLMLRYNMSLLDFDLIYSSNFFNYPYLSSSKFINKFKFWSKIGILKLLIPAGFYCLVLKKSVEIPIKLTYDTPFAT